jgi:uncharacterized membrane protein YeiH
MADRGKPLMLAPTLQSLLTVMDLVAVAVFAITGALVASRKEMDIIGFLWLGIITGVGGGTVRDLLLGLPVFWMHEPVYVVTSVVMSVAVYFTAHLAQSRMKILLWLDAVGLSMVTVAGTAKGLDAGVGPINAIVMGVITASLGGIIRDILGHEPSIILRKEIYVTASLVGALIYAASIGLGANNAVGTALGFSVAFVVRGFAMIYGWSLPTYRSRPGVSQSNQDRS